MTRIVIDSSHVICLSGSDLSVGRVLRTDHIRTIHSNLSSAETTTNVKQLLQSVYC